MKTKVCTGCKHRKSVEKFSVRRASKDGLSYRCRDCLRLYRSVTYADHAEKTRDRAVRWNRANPSARSQIIRRHTLKKKYGLTEAQYEQMLQKQMGLCAICKGEDGRRLSVDHNHLTGKVRGLLCNRCNYMLGLLQDSSELANCAARYLRKFA